MAINSKPFVSINYRRKHNPMSSLPINTHRLRRAIRQNLHTSICAYSRVPLQLTRHLAIVTLGYVASHEWLVVAMTVIRQEQADLKLRLRRLPCEWPAAVARRKDDTIINALQRTGLDARMEVAVGVTRVVSVIVYFENRIAALRVGGGEDGESERAEKLCDIRSCGDVKNRRDVLLKPA